MPNLACRELEQYAGSPCFGCSDAELTEIVSSVMRFNIELWLLRGLRHENAHVRIWLILEGPVEGFWSAEIVLLSTSRHPTLLCVNLELRAVLVPFHQRLIKQMLWKGLWKSVNIKLLVLLHKSSGQTGGLIQSLVFYLAEILCF